ncbi:MAG: hypothetical protein SWK76_06830 [Actinomycetota bacterium]|nr:hypothetical protein [Actinomycetota bacterium]
MSNEILGTKPHPIGIMLRNEYTCKLMGRLPWLPDSPFFLDMEMERFANLGAAVA